MIDFQELQDVCNKMIQGTKSIAGDDIDIDDPVYSEIQDEIDKLRTNVDDVEWEQFRKSCVEFLKKSKNIRICGFLWLVLTKLYGQEGFFTGAKIFLHLLTNFKDDYYPRSKEERKHQLIFLNKSFARLSNQIVFPYKDNSKNNNSFDILDKIKQEINQYSSINIIKDINEIPQKQTSSISIDKKEKDDQVDDKKKDSQKKNDKKSIDQNEVVEATVNIENVYPHLISIANQLRKNDISDPLAYRLMRVAKWDQYVNILTKPNKEDSLYENIHIQRKKSIVELNNDINSSPEEIIEKCENMFIEADLWLDLQRMIVRAMEKLDHNKYSNTINTIKFEIYKLLRRFPKLPDKKWNSPKDECIADNATKQWINSLISNSNEIKTTIIQDDQDIDIKKIKRIIEQNDFSKAFNMLNTFLKSAIDLKQSFKYRLTAGQLLLSSGREIEAKIVLEELLKQAQEKKLDTYDVRFFLNICDSLIELYKIETNEENLDKTTKIKSIISRYRLVDFQI